MFLGGNLAEAQHVIRNAMGSPFVIIAVIFMAGVMFAGLVLITKRIRDMGLPVLISVAALVVSSFLVNWLFGEPANRLFSTAVIICLQFIPGNSFGNRGR